MIIKHYIENFVQTQKLKQLWTESDINDAFKSIYSTVISNIQKSLRKCLGWIIDSVIDHNINISKYNTLVGSSYIKLPKELHHPRKGFINI